MLTVPGMNSLFWNSTQIHRKRVYLCPESILILLFQWAHLTGRSVFSNAGSSAEVLSIFFLISSISMPLHLPNLSFLAELLISVADLTISRSGINVFILFILLEFLLRFHHIYFSIL